MVARRERLSRMADSRAFERLVAEIRDCTICTPYLPLGPRPIVRGRPSARLLIISQYSRPVLSL